MRKIKYKKISKIKINNYVVGQLVETDDSSDSYYYYCKTYREAVEWIKSRPVDVYKNKFHIYKTVYTFKEGWE